MFPEGPLCTRCHNERVLVLGLTEFAYEYRRENVCTIICSVFKLCALVHM